MYSRESLSLLREKVDLVELISSYLPLKRIGNTYKGLCPFHEEKTPSFIIQPGGSHYHCFGCGAHGDAISFLINHLNMGFVEAIEWLANRFHFALKKRDRKDEDLAKQRDQGKRAVGFAMHFYHFYLLYSEEGSLALRYLYRRSIDLNAIKMFKLGLAPKNGHLFPKVMNALQFSTSHLEQVGLLTPRDHRPLFVNRILLPILDHWGNPIGFSARRYEEETIGPKYINTPDTLLFKKSRVLYGIYFSRQRIAKERRVILVEGQIDALRLIRYGLNLTLAIQGTALSENHLHLLKRLGVRCAYVAFDGDRAGQRATQRVGNQLQSEGIEVKVVCCPEGTDPDDLLSKEGVHGFIACMQRSRPYLHFLFDYLSQGFDLSSPTEKSRCVQQIVEQIRHWRHPLLIHESVRQLARRAQIPEKILGVEVEDLPPRPLILNRQSISHIRFDPNRILEVDLLRWLFLFGETIPPLKKMVRENIKEEHFFLPICRHFFSLYFRQNPALDLLHFVSQLKKPEEKKLFNEIVKKKVNPKRAMEGAKETTEQLLTRNWMKQREEIKESLEKGGHSEVKVLELIQAFDRLKDPPSLL